MYINREIDHILLDWKNANRHKPLILRGVRQCGKTSAVRNLSQQFADYIELNLEKEPDIGKIFEGELNINRIINRLELHYKKINRHSPYLSITLHKCYPYYLFGISTFPSSVYHSIALRKFSITIV